MHWGVHCYSTRKREATPLLGYSDIDLAGDVNDQKSTSSLTFFLDGGPIAWQSTKQKVVALSSCETEYMHRGCRSCVSGRLASSPAS